MRFPRFTSIMEIVDYKIGLNEAIQLRERVLQEALIAERKELVESNKAKLDELRARLIAFREHVDNKYILGVHPEWRGKSE